MALSHEEIIKKMKAEEAKKESKKDNGKVTDLGSMEESPEMLELKKQLAESKAQLDKTESERQKLQNQVQDNFDTKSFNENQNAVNTILNGNVKQYFKKHYSYDVGDKKLEFDVRMHLQSIQELTKIEVLAQQMTEGMLDNLQDGLAYTYRALATFKIVGDSVPDWLTDDSGYRLDIVQNVYGDYLEWSETFRQQQVR